MFGMLYQPSHSLIAAHVDRVGGRVPRPADAVADVDAAQVGAAVAIEPQVLEVLVPVEQREELDDVRAPAGDVARQLLEHRRRALAAPVVDRLGDVGAHADRARRLQVGPGEVGEQRLRRRRGGREVEVVQRDVADEVADVGHDPALAGLDEEVVPELLRVVAQRVGLLGDRAGAARAARRRARASAIR